MGWRVWGGGYGGVGVGGIPPIVVAVSAASWLAELRMHMTHTGTQCACEMNLRRMCTI